MKKNYILDTNVILHDPNAIHNFHDNAVVIPIRVIEEIDHFKRELSELGRNARQVSRMMDGLRAKGKLSDGIPLDNGGTLRIDFPRETDDVGINDASADAQILRLALALRKKHPHEPCIVVSKDINLRLKADALGLDATDYETDRVDISELYVGHSELGVSHEELEAFRTSGTLPYSGEARSPNEYIMLKDSADESNTALGRLDAEQHNVVALRPVPRELEHVRPRNKEQHYAMDALLNDHIKLVTMIGKAGTGKTLLAVAAGLYKVLEERAFRKLLVSRPTFPMGKDIGYLPGTVEDKLNPWMQPVYDALDLLSNGYKSKVTHGREHLIDAERVGVEPLTYIRGRSIP
ncbi:MAG: PhoH family protein, partial [Kiritimatiellae bacterium]|nr:PhoH family protein [Kiritimatiellia bacterium]